jgi:hypothetical protein
MEILLGMIGIAIIGFALKFLLNSESTNCQNLKK